MGRENLEQPAPNENSSAAAKMVLEAASYGAGMIQRLLPETQITDTGGEHKNIPQLEFDGKLDGAKPATRDITPTSSNAQARVKDGTDSGSIENDSPDKDFIEKARTLYLKSSPAEANMSFNAGMGTAKEHLPVIEIPEGLNTSMIVMAEAALEELDIQTTSDIENSEQSLVGTEDLLPPPDTNETDPQINLDNDTDAQPLSQADSTLGIIDQTDAISPPNNPNNATSPAEAVAYKAPVAVSKDQGNAAIAPSALADNTRPLAGTDAISPPNNPNNATSPAEAVAYKAPVAVSKDQGNAAIAPSALADNTRPLAGTDAISPPNNPNNATSPAEAVAYKAPVAVSKDQGNAAIAPSALADNTRPLAGTNAISPPNNPNNATSPAEAVAYKAPVAVSKDQGNAAIAPSALADNTRPLAGTDAISPPNNPNNATSPAEAVAYKAPVAVSKDQGNAAIAPSALADNTRPLAGTNAISPPNNPNNATSPAEAVAYKAPVAVSKDQGNAAIAPSALADNTRPLAGTDAISPPNNPNNATSPAEAVAYKAPVAVSKDQGNAAIAPSALADNTRPLAGTNAISPPNNPNNATSPADNVIIVADNSSSTNTSIAHQNQTVAETGKPQSGAPNNSDSQAVVADQNTSKAPVGTPATISPQELARVTGLHSNTPATDAMGNVINRPGMNEGFGAGAMAARGMQSVLSEQNSQTVMRGFQGLLIAMQQEQGAAAGIKYVGDAAQLPIGKVGNILAPETVVGGTGKKGEAVAGENLGITYFPVAGIPITKSDKGIGLDGEPLQTGKPGVTTNPINLIGGATGTTIPAATTTTASTTATPNTQSTVPNTTQTNVKDPNATDIKSLVAALPAIEIIGLEVEGAESNTATTSRKEINYEFIESEPNRVKETDIGNWSFNGDIGKRAASSAGSGTSPVSDFSKLKILGLFGLAFLYVIKGAPPISKAVLSLRSKSILEHREYVVKAGDTLGKLALENYGDSRYAKRLYQESISKKHKGKKALVRIANEDDIEAIKNIQLEPGTVITLLSRSEARLFDIAQRNRFKQKKEKQVFKAQKKDPFSFDNIIPSWIKEVPALSGVYRGLFVHLCSLKDATSVKKAFKTMTAYMVEQGYVSQHTNFSRSLSSTATMFTLRGQPEGVFAV